MIRFIIASMLLAASLNADDFDFVNTAGHACSSHDHKEKDKGCPRGPKGPRGKRGLTGPAGSAPGSIIPFASGTNFITLTSGPSGPGQVAVVGFGSANDTFSLTGGNIDLGLDLGAKPDFAFTMPRDGTITSLSAHFTGMFGIFTTTLTIHAQIYRSTGADLSTNTFVPIASSYISLFPTIPSTTPVSGITNFYESVNAQDRILVVFSMTGSQLDLAQQLSGRASAGITIH